MKLYTIRPGRRTAGRSFQPEKYTAAKPSDFGYRPDSASSLMTTRLSRPQKELLRSNFLPLISRFRQLYFSWALLQSRPVLSAGTAALQFLGRAPKQIVCGRESTWLNEAVLEQADKEIPKMRRPMRGGNCAYHARFPSERGRVVINRTLPL